VQQKEFKEVDRQIGKQLYSLGVKAKLILQLNFILFADKGVKNHRLKLPELYKSLRL
jgi:hypothetical protein